jgi:mRNA interferase HicA
MPGWEIVSSSPGLCGGPARGASSLIQDQGATIKDGSKHLKVYLNGKQTTVPRHPGKEISNAFVKAIKKQLNIQ